MKITRKRSKIRIIMLSVFVFLLAAAGIAYALARSDPNPPLAAAEHADGIAVRMMQAAVTGEPVCLTEEEAGFLLSRSLTRDKRIQGVRLSINDDQTVNVYVPVLYKQMPLGISAVVAPGLDSASKQITAAVQSVRIGRLPVPPGWFLSQVKKEAPDRFQVQGNTVRMQSSLLSGLSLSNGNILHLSGLSVSDDGFLVNITADMDTLKNYLERFLKRAR
ncbi:MAG: DUF2140 domain-containing protein [Eubacteriales bacterium]|jgi:hypothetical protein